MLFSFLSYSRLGKQKRYYGWSALHVSAYFNHIEIVKLLLQVIMLIRVNSTSLELINLSSKLTKFSIRLILLIIYFFHVCWIKKQPDIDINICNYENDTPLHKACLASRYVSKSVQIFAIKRTV
jgi:hypothetical protein